MSVAIPPPSDSNDIDTDRDRASDGVPISSDSPEPSLGLLLALWLVFASLAFAIYWPALHGPFISDDMVYIVANPWTETLSVESVAGIFNPMGEARFHVANYAPLHLLASAIELAVFWDDPLGYHVVDILLHSVNATLLVALLMATGLSSSLALVGGFLFLVHPGNVEAVAWLSQLKTTASFAFTLGALLAFRRHPGWATLLFVAGLLTKASAAVALPMAAALLWVWGRSRTVSRASWNWIAVWTVLFLVYSVPQVTAIHPRGTTVVAAYENFWVHLRTIASIGVHYLVMAYTTLGVSHTQEHPPVFSLLDPWWLAAIPLTAFFVWRIVATLQQGKMEGVYWLGAACAFAPISQYLPFSHPIADRYLYYLLPGLIGGTLFLLRDVSDSLMSRGGGAEGSWSVGLRRVAGVVVIVAVVAMGWVSSQRAHLWTDQTLLSLDSARNFPEGRSALMLEARQAAQRRDVARTVELIRRAGDLGRDYFAPLVFDSQLAPVAEHPLYRELIQEYAGRYIDLVKSRNYPTVSELGSVSMAYWERGEFDEAEAALERAVERGGIAGRNFPSELEALRNLRAEIEASTAYQWNPGSALDAAD